MRTTGSVIFLTAMLSPLWWIGLAGADEIPEILVPESHSFCVVLDGNCWEEADFSGKEDWRFDGRTEFKSIILGGPNRFAWLEQSPGGRARAFRSDLPGIRLMALQFGKSQDGQPAIVPVTGFIGEQAQIKRIKQSEWNRQILFKYWYKGIRPLSGKSAIYSDHNASLGSFHRASRLVDQEKIRRPQVADDEDKVKRLIMFPEFRNKQADQHNTDNTDDFNRTYALACDNDGKLVVQAHCRHAFGQFRVEFNHQFPLPNLVPEVSQRLQKLFADGNLSEGETASQESEAPSIAANEWMFCCWWKKPQDYAVVISKSKLDRCLYAVLTQSIQKRLNEYDYQERKFEEASSILALLSLARKFNVSIKDELGNQDSSKGETAILNCSLSIEELIFRLSLTIKGEPWQLFYNSRTHKACLIPQSIVWKPVRVPLQYQATNRPLVFVMMLSPSPDISLSTDQITAAMKSQAEKFKFPDLLRAQVLVGIPDQVDPETSWKEIKSKTGTVQDLTKVDRSRIRFANSRITQGKWAIKLLVKPDFAMDLKTLYLTRNGLPVDLNFEQYFIGKRSQSNSAALQTRILSKDFEIVTAEDDFADITVIVDRSVFTQSGKDELLMRLRYPGESREFKKTTSKNSGSAVVQVPRKTNDGKVQLDLEYWSDTRQQWIKSEHAMEGLMVIDE